MKKISKTREKEIENILKSDADEDKWDNRELGYDPVHVKAAPEYSKTQVNASVGTSIRMPLELIRELKKIAEEEGMPYQTLVKSILTKYVRGRGDAA